ncbi:MAG: hypothetical protein OXC67_05360 [Flavobacteriaceae bacterium]|nr:hypothetical protein [Flavobacteriaceae bacterium]
MKGWIDNGDWAFGLSNSINKTKSRCTVCNAKGFSYTMVKHHPTGQEKALYDVGLCNKQNKCPQPNQMLKGRVLFERFEKEFGVEKNQDYTFCSKEPKPTPPRVVSKPFNGSLSFDI